MAEVRRKPPAKTCTPPKFDGYADVSFGVLPRAPTSQVMAIDVDACAAHWTKHAPASGEVNLQTLQGLIAGSPAALQLMLTQRLVVEFLEGWLLSSPAASPAPAAARVPAASGGRGSTIGRIASSPKTLLHKARSGGRSSSPSPSRSDGSMSPTRARKFNQAQYLAACRDLPPFAAQTFAGTLIVGNGRSVLNCGAGAAVNRYQTVVRFNDFQIEGFESDVGNKTDIWVVSDWTAVKLFAKYPDRKIPTIIAIPYKFMGKPYYHERRAEVTAELSEELKARVTFVPAQDVQRLIEENHFGDRWPSSGLITIIYMLNLGKPRVHLHGFDFFKEIGEHGPILVAHELPPLPITRSPVLTFAPPNTGCPPFSLSLSPVQTAKSITWRTHTRQITTLQRRSAFAWASCSNAASTFSSEGSSPGGGRHPP